MNARSWIAICVLSLPTVALADGEFPIPSVDGKPAFASEDQKSYRVPLRFAAVERFYREHFKARAVTVTAGREDGARILTLVTREKNAAWTRATVREGQVDTRIDVKPVLRADAEQVEGNAAPAVQFVIGRNPEATRMAEEINHLGR